MRRRTFMLAGAAILASPALLRGATPLPTGPVRIIVGFAPGGGTDVLARVIGQKLSTMWNTPVIVENKPGATGVIAADYVSRQPPDGSTLLMAHVNSHAIAPALLPKRQIRPAARFLADRAGGRDAEHAHLQHATIRPHGAGGRRAVQKPSRADRVRFVRASAPPSILRSRCSCSRRRSRRCTCLTRVPARWSWI